MRARVKQLQWLTLPVLLGSVMLAMRAPWVIQHWMTRAQVGSHGLYLTFAILTTVSTWSNVFAYFLNAIGDTALQLRTSLLALAVHFPCCYLFTKVLGLGLTGINLGTLVSLGFFAVAGPLHVWQLLRERAATVAPSESPHDDDL
jgi:Na+-driven multidrug efflux pump